MTGRRLSTIRWSIWSWWVLASALGGALGSALGLELASLDLSRSDMPHTLDEMIIFGLLWTGMGAGQWMVLRRCFSGAGWWVAVNALGGVFIGAAAGLLGNIAPIVAAYAGAGLLLGVPQWLVLRRHVPHAQWWLIASPAGWALGTLSAIALDRALAMPVSETAGLTILFGVASGVAATVTGAVLTGLLSLTPASRRLGGQA